MAESGIAARVTVRYLEKLAEEREKWPDGRLMPVEGDEVYQIVRGPFGTGASIKGVVYKARGKNPLRVKVTGGGSVMGIGQAPVGRTYALDHNWTVVNDPHVHRKEEERKEKERLEIERKKNEVKEGEELIEAEGHKLGLHRAKSFSEIEPGMTVYSLAVTRPDPYDPPSETNKPYVDVQELKVEKVEKSYFTYIDPFHHHESTSGNLTHNHYWIKH